MDILSFDFAGQTIELSVGNLIAIVVAIAIAVLLQLLLWLRLPIYIEQVLHWLDSLIPADLSPYARWVSRPIIWGVAIILLAITALIVATQLGVDTSGIVRSSRGTAADVGGWIGPRLLRIAIIVVIAMIVTRVVEQLTPTFVNRFLTRRADVSAQPGELEKRSKTLESVLTGTLKLLVLALALLTILDELEVPVGPLLAGAGVVGIAIGFGAQSLIRDLIAGVFILLEDQYRVGDVVNIAGVGGLVEDINLRRTVLRDLDYIQHIIPNGEVRIANNYTKEKSRVKLDIPVAYKTNLDHAIQVLNRVGSELSQDPTFGPLITDQLKVLWVDEFQDSGIAIRVLGETLPIRQWEVAGEFRKRIKQAFDEEGIEIPFPHRTLYWGSGVETRVRQLIDMQIEQQATQRREDTPNTAQ